MESGDKIAAIKGLAASREKYWEERSADEKIEVLKNCVMQLQGSLDAYERTVSTLSNHCHGADGRILIDYNRNSGCERAGWSYDFKRLLTEKERG